MCVARLRADTLVPSSFKARLDRVVRAGRTFYYADRVPEGLEQPGKTAGAFVASGSVVMCSANPVPLFK